MDEEWVPLDDWWLMIKMGSKSRSFMKKFEKELNKKGFTIDKNKSKTSKGTNHLKLAVKDERTDVEKEVTVTVTKDSKKVIQNAVAQVVGIFSGRKRRGQGSFRLDDNVESADMEKLAPLAAFAVGVGAQAGKTMMEEKSDNKEVEKLAPATSAFVQGSAIQVGKTVAEKLDDGEVEKLNFRNAFSQLSEGVNYKNALEALDGGSKPTPVPKDAESSYNKLRRKP